MATPSKGGAAGRGRGLQRRVEELQARLDEADETLRAIREGEVDAVVVSGTRGDQIFSLVGTDSIYRLIVETMLEAAFTVTLEGTILFCNAQFCRLVRRPLEQLVGRSFLELVAGGDRRAATALLGTTLRRPFRQRVVFEVPGGGVPTLVSANVLVEPGGRSICVVASELTELEDSTELILRLRREQQALQIANEELKATEEQLSEQNAALSASRIQLEQARARYEELFESAPDGYLVTDPEGRIQEANHAATRILGRPAAALKGKSFLGLLPAAGRAGCQELLDSLNAWATPSSAQEFEFRPPQGPVLWASVTAAASRDERGAIVGLRWLIRDATERRMVAESLLRLTADLERSNRDLEAFAGIASHDLQEPLRGVAGLLRLLRDRHGGGLDETGRTYIDRASDGAVRMSALIGDLLEYSRVGADAPRLAPVDLAAVVEGVRGDLQAAIDESGAAITVGALPTVTAEAGQVRQLFQNLIGNALKFRAAGRRPRVRVSARREAGAWVFQVADNGIGIRPEHREQVFAIFNRLHARTEYPGTGIGLAICKRIVERHGGRIWIESNAGGGTTFRFTLPAAGA